MVAGVVVMSARPRGVCGGAPSAGCTNKRPCPGNEARRARRRLVARGGAASPHLALPQPASPQPGCGERSGAKRSRIGEKPAPACPGAGAGRKRPGGHRGLSRAGPGRPLSGPRLPPRCPSASPAGRLKVTRGWFTMGVWVQLYQSRKLFRFLRW